MKELRPEIVLYNRLRWSESISSPCTKRRASVLRGLSCSPSSLWICSVISPRKAENPRRKNLFRQLSSSMIADNQFLKGNDSFSFRRRCSKRALPRERSSSGFSSWTNKFSSAPKSVKVPKSEPKFVAGLTSTARYSPQSDCRSRSKNPLLRRRSGHLLSDRPHCPCPCPCLCPCPAFGSWPEI